MNARGKSPTIGVVGPCGSGKTTLIDGLSRLGIQARQIAQEHSYVPDMWKKLSQPDMLVYLEASFETCTERKSFNWSRHEYAEQIRRLRHARAHADVRVDTDTKSAGEVLEKVLQALRGGQSSSLAL